MMNFGLEKLNQLIIKVISEIRFFSLNPEKKWVWRLEPCPMQGMTVNADNTATYYTEDSMTLYYTEDSMTLSIYVVKYQTFYVWIPFSI